jgi:hypothetical protein
MLYNMNYTKEINKLDQELDNFINLQLELDEIAGKFEEIIENAQEKLDLKYLDIKNKKKLLEDAEKAEKLKALVAIMNIELVEKASWPNKWLKELTNA